MNELAFNAASIRPSELFDGRMFRVPDYQRGYAWEKEQFDEFLEDLDLLSPGGVHYFGNVVLHNAKGDRAKDKSGNTYEVFDIVDGQQRLTTLVLFLDAIRREFFGFEEEAVADGIYSRYIAVPGGNGQKIPRLTLNSDCHQFYFERILHDTAFLDGQKMRSHKNMEFAKKHFHKYLLNMRKVKRDKHLQWLGELRKRVCDQLVLTVYTVEKDADAGVIFEATNNRGKPISEIEKAKNYLLYLAAKLELSEPSDLADRINSNWTHIYTRLMASGLGRVENEDRLLRVHWLMAHDPTEKNWDGAKSLKEEFHLRDYKRNHDELLAKLLEYVSTLRGATTAYCDVERPDHSDAFADLLGEESLRQEVIAASEKLRRLQVVAPFLPLLVALRMKKPGRGELYLRTVKLCEIYAFRVYRLLQRRANLGRPELFRHGHRLYTNQSTIRETMQGLIDLIKKNSPQADVDLEFQLRKDADWYDWTGLRYFLYEYEYYLGELRNKSSKLKWKQLDKSEHSVEHILPQTPTARYWLIRSPTCPA